MILLFVLFATLTGCSSGFRLSVSNENKENGNIASDRNRESSSSEIVITKKVIDEIYFDKRTGVIFLVNQTISDLGIAQDDLGRLVNKHKEQIKETTFAGFLNINSNRISINEAVCSPPRCHLYEQEEADRIFTEDERRIEMKKRFPSLEGVVRVSRVGFDREETQAIVYVEKYSGPKSGLGEIVILNKIADEWKISERINIWLS
ncbi:MAG: hypothetical protein IPJ30_23315 [Acidobacteria bacterium]|nr:hypothetical protein [Acidobacteriota bacterium]MBK8148845.1 hypothetical protein [Acidobacteriota bacterium]